MRETSPQPGQTPVEPCQPRFRAPFPFAGQRSLRRRHTMGAFTSFAGNFRLARGSLDRCDRSSGPAGRRCATAAGPSLGYPWLYFFPAIAAILRRRGRRETKQPIHRLLAHRGDRRVDVRSYSWTEGPFARGQLGLCHWWVVHGGRHFDPVESVEAADVAARAPPVFIAVRSRRRSTPASSARGVGLGCTLAIGVDEQHRKVAR